MSDTHGGHRPGSGRPRKRADLVDDLPRITIRAPADVLAAFARVPGESQEARLVWLLTATGQL